jgi:hypothetical protein
MTAYMDKRDVSETYNVHGLGHGEDDKGEREDMEVLTCGQLHADRIDRACSTGREERPLALLDSARLGDGGVGETLETTYSR